jgi:cellulose biosynthesis protein BcsQ
MKKITIGNHKGGVGKTALTHNLAAQLSGRGVRVLAVDIDPQSSLTHVCHVPTNHPTLADVWGQTGDGMTAQPHAEITAEPHDRTRERVRFGVRISPDTLAQLDRLLAQERTKRRGATMGELMEKIIDHYINS